MSDAIQQAERATQALLRLNDDQLYAELGKRMRLVRDYPAASGHYDLQPDRTLESQGIVEDFAGFGRRYFQRLNLQMYAVVCGSDAEDSEERQELIRAFGIGRDAVAPVLAASLVGYLGLAPAIAAVVATLVIRLFFQPGYEAMCDTWKTKLPAADR